MKHLLNNLTEQEKNNIREQHTGGMRVSNNRFKALLENKLGNSKPLVEQFDDEDDYDFGFESPFCPSCKGNGCGECDGSGMKRNSVVNNDDDDEELYRGAPERLVKHKNGKIVGTHKHGVGYTPNEHGIRLGHSSHPTSIPNFTKFDDEDDYDFEGNVETHLESKTKRHYLINEQQKTVKPGEQPVNQNIKPIINKVASEGIKNVTPAMMSADQFKGKYQGSSFGGTFNGVNYLWDCTGVPGMLTSQFMVAGDIISQTSKNMFEEINKTPDDNDYNPESPSVGFYDGNGVNFVIYSTSDGKVKCLKFL